MSACRAANRRPSSLVPALMIAGAGCCSGLGWETTSSTWRYSPSKSKGSASVQARRMIVIHSAARA